MISRIGAALGAVALVASACGSGDSGSSIRVAAASSLTDVMTELAAAFEAESGVEVELNLGASSALALQVEEGAPVDVFASADVALVADLRDRTSGIGAPVEFATNDLVIAVRVDADGRIDALDDFTDDDLLLGACAAQVPCGGYAATAFRLADIDPALDTEETDVRSLAAKIASGDLDGGLVYRTDVVAAADSLRAIELPADAAVDAVYGAATVDRAGRDTSYGSTASGDDFVEFLLSSTAQEILSAQGFGPP
ncbi:MAG: molybdate ABC transporter substrate-binding protein [Actinomycetota bacterium]